MSEEGGMNAADATRRCLRHTLTDELALNYTWEGASGKLRLRDLAIMVAITGKLGF